MSNCEHSFANGSLDEIVDNCKRIAVTSTAIKDKNKNLDDFFLVNDSLIIRNNEFDHDDEINAENNQGLDMKYLIIRKPIQLEERNNSRIFNFETPLENFTTACNSSKSTIADWDIESKDEDYFARHTHEVSKMTMNSSLPQEQKRFATKEANKENRTQWNDTSLLSRAMNEDTILDVTKLAYEFHGRTNVAIPSNVPAPTINQPQISKDEFANVQLLCNKPHLFWIGVSLKNNGIKSFTLDLVASRPVNATLTILQPPASDQPTPAFHFCNQAGGDLHQTREVEFKPRCIQTFYTMFNATDTAYHQSMIIIKIGGRKFKIHLFGYAEAAHINLIDFTTTETDDNGRRVWINNVTGSGKSTIRIFNSGARTGYVGFFSYDQSAVFHPRSMLIVSKATMEVEIRFSEPSLTFCMFFVDEELRRACRTSASECLADNNKYASLEVLHLFWELPVERNIATYLLPKHDWRPYLLKQINNSFCFARLSTTTPTTMAGFCTADGNDTDSRTTVCSGGIIDHYSARTVDRQTAKSSATGVSSVTNHNNTIDDIINANIIYMNRTASYAADTGLYKLGQISIAKDVHTFPKTCIGNASYAGILIRNNNSFPVNWLMSGMLLTTPQAFNFSSESSSNRGAESSSIYSLNSVALYHPESSFSVNCDHGVLKSLESVLIRVKFEPKQTGIIECKCTITLTHTGISDRKYAKEIDFHAEGVKQELSIPRCRIPLVSVTQRILHFSAFLNGPKVEQKLELKNKSNHLKLIFMSKPDDKRFEILSTKININKGRNIMQVFFSPFASKLGIYEDCLLLSDDEGNCMPVILRAVIN